MTEYLAPHQINNPDDSLDGYNLEIVKRLLSLTNQTPPRENLFEWLGVIKSYRIYMWGLANKFSTFTFDYVAYYKM